MNTVTAPARIGFSKGSRVSHVRISIDGKLMEDPTKSPTTQEPDRMVVRVKWDDKSESIENVKDLY